MLPRERMKYDKNCHSIVQLTRRRRKVTTAAGAIPARLGSEVMPGGGWASRKTRSDASTRASSIGGDVKCLLSLLAPTCAYQEMLSGDESTSLPEEMRAAQQVWRF